MSEPVPMCERCLRPQADCGAEQWDNKAVIECRDPEIELLKARVEELESKIEADGAWEAELAMRGMSDG